MKDTGRFRSARAEPDVVLAVRDEASAAGGEGSLVGQGHWQVLLRKPFPVLATVLGDDQEKSALDRVAEGNAVFVVPEGEGNQLSSGAG